MDECLAQADEYKLGVERPPRRLDVARLVTDERHGVNGVSYAAMRSARLWMTVKGAAADKDAAVADAVYALGVRSRWGVDVGAVRAHLSRGKVSAPRYDELMASMFKGGW